MSEKQVALVAAAALASVGVLADYFLKLGSEREEFGRSPWFWLGLVVYAGMAAGWVSVMRHLSFAEIGIVYSVTTVLLLALVGVTVLKETLHGYEMLGAGLAITSIVLLARFG